MTLAETSNGPTWFVYLMVVLFAILSAVLLSGRGSWLIAGYNTAPKKEKEKYNAQKLCRVVGGGMAIITVLMLIMALFDDVLPASFGYIFAGIVFLVAVMIGVLGNTICKR